MSDERSTAEVLTALVAAAVAKDLAAAVEVAIEIGRRLERGALPAAAEDVPSLLTTPAGRSPGRAVRQTRPLVEGLEVAPPRRRDGAVPAVLTDAARAQFPDVSS